MPPPSTNRLSFGLVVFFLLFAVTVDFYWLENHGRLPRCDRDVDNGTQHCMWVSHDTYRNLLKYLNRPLPGKPAGQTLPVSYSPPA